MFFETHAHYTDEAFDGDREALLASMPENGVDHIVIPGYTMEASRMAVELAEKYPFVWAAVGIHPENCGAYDGSELGELRELLHSPRVVAVGEMGLDYYWEENPPREQQKRCAEDMFALAAEFHKPVIFHERNACGDAMELVRAHPEVHGVFHCFGGSPETALELTRLGWYISFTGVLTFKNARKAPEAAAAAPADRLMIETDSPYMAPVPHRGERNSSLFLPEIARALGRARGITMEEAARLTEENAMRFFGIADERIF